ncbi:S8 family serine peptidase [Saccharopolyspora sp. NFXS83]|uniref:S8 family serine peptidase n=1 Tax=Saccharopolyspora sp. NFXS83 TaxID=2993560 RepID=UPI00224A900F|nr:S8 family serine peptidase [Saccharopolyspora sp. NFXS83]MCX2729193.1 S8 family serine peptidase [Saccharopolyspora sp. NFXS83]
MPVEIYAPDKIAVELTPEANALVPPSLPDSVQDGVFTSFGVDLVDAALQFLQVQSITRLYREIEPYDVDPALLESMRGTYVVRFAGTVDLATIIQVLATTPGVAHVERVGMGGPAVTPNDPKLAEQWGLDAIRAPLAWDRQKGAGFTKIAVIDSGCDKSHPDLAPRLLGGWDFCENPSVPAGFQRVGDFTTPDDDPQDEAGHGTAMAGILGAATNNGVGVAGTTWAGAIRAGRVVCRTLHQVTGELGSALNTDELAKAVKWGGEWSHVVNLSLYSPANAKHLSDAVQYALQARTVLVAGMGNFNNNVPLYPAAYPGVIAVGAIQKQRFRWVQGGSQGSNTGTHISVTAPGKNIAGLDLWASFGSPQYGSSTGTSPAAAFVSGVAALLISCNVQLTAAQVKQVIEDTASTSVGEGGLPWPNPSYGHGVVDARAAVDRVLDGPLPPP